MGPGIGNGRDPVGTTDTPKSVDLQEGKPF
jgi:hypothetical protein